MTNYFVLHTGGLGDLVLASALVAGLSGPGRRICLATREDIGPIVALFPEQPDEWMALGGGWSTLRADVFVDATLRPTKFGREAAAAVGATRNVDWTGVPMGDDIKEGERYAALLRALGGAQVSVFPWRLPAGHRRQAEDWLDSQGLRAGEYLVCIPGGAPGTEVKRWPAARFVELLRAQSRPVLLLGDRNEHAMLADLSAQMPGAGAYFAGRPQDLPLAAALVALAAGYCGNDTGPVHLAQAFGVPGVAIFGGGGEWPRYAPWAKGSRGLLHPLPCYGCGWDCCLGHGLCVELIPVGPVASALESVLADPQQEPRWEALDLLGAESRQILTDGSVRYREGRAELARRQQAIVELEVVAAERLTVLNDLHHVAEERLAVLQSNHEAAAEQSRQLAGWEARLTAISPPIVRAVHIASGLGAGNIGDELMARAFWKALPREVTLEVALFGEAVRHRESYPPQHRYHALDYGAGEGGHYHWPGLLVGTTPVTEGEGRHWPLDFLQRRLRVFHERRLPVDAAGVGVEPIESVEGRAIFHEVFAPIRSWTVRSDQCRCALLELGIAPDRIRVGADWAWLWAPGEDKQEWARKTWRDTGVAPDRPLLLVNLVNMQWRDMPLVKGNLAAALDAVAERTGAQVAFWANDCRPGEFFDAAAGDDLAARMTRPLLRLPSHYYSVDEAIALIGCATIALGARYHFLIQSVLGGSVPIALTRGPKMAALADELELPCAGSVTAVEAGLVSAACEEALARRLERRERLDARQAALRERARLNLSFLRELAPYSAAFARC